MNFRGIFFRLIFVAFTTWVLGAIIESFGWAFYFALLPILFHEMCRPRATRRTINPEKQ